jgi:two-component sensor histidine kinase
VDLKQQRDARQHEHSNATAAFLSDGGEMGLLTRADDWAGSPLGAPQNWPQSLRTAVRLMLTSHHPMFIWWGPDLIQFYNDAYRATMGPERHPSALGDRGRDCWAEIWPIIGPQIDHVMQGLGATWQEEQLVPVTRFGGVQQVWWTYGYSPIDDEGGVGGVLVVCKDVTQEHLAKEALALANAKLVSDVDRIRSLLAQAPGFVAALVGPEHRFEFTNSAYERLVGRSDLVGLSVLEALPEVAEQGFIALLDQVYATGEAHVGAGVALTLRDSAGGASQTVYVDFVYQPVVDAGGAVTGIFVEGSDVTARVLAEQRQLLILEEMNHRVKNTLATVQSLATMTGKSAQSVGEFRTALSGRIQAMAKTQDLLIHGRQEAVPVLEILEAELAPYRDGSEQISLHCAPVVVSAKASANLGLLVHELATNAAKHGALSSEGGRLVIACEPEGAGAVLEWREVSERSVTAAPSTGFGMVLIKRLARALGGEVKIDLAAGGLHATVRFATEFPGPHSATITGAPVDGLSVATNGGDDAAEWLARIAQAQDRKAFSMLFSHYAPRVKGYLIAAGDEPEQAEAMAYNTLVEVWRRAPEFDPAKRTAAAWIFTVLRDCRLDL